MPGHLWRFATCEFDALRHELRVGGRVVVVEAKPLEVLHQLLLHAGEVVTKDELLESVWPGVMVVDGSLATAVSKLRKALGTDEGVVVTLPRVGYRLGVSVQRESAAPPEWPDLCLVPGDAVPGRPQWRLSRRLDLSLASEVWLADHPKTRELRVFKFAPDVARVKSLKREVTLARLLRESLGDRADFVRMLEWNFDTAPYFIESEYAGPNLAEWAASEGGLSHVSLARRVRLICDIAAAVAAAHGLDVLHKDLKPGNILVSSNGDGSPQIKVADFGSAALLAPRRLDALGITGLGFTNTADGDVGALTGTMMYMAPEVLAGQSPTVKSDVFALGLLLYQAVVGDFRKPLAAGWEADIADPILREDIADTASGDPARRLGSAGELAERLSTIERRRAARETEALAAERARVAAHADAATRARRPWLLLAGVVVLAAIGGGFLFRAGGSRAELRTIAVLPLQNGAPVGGPRPAQGSRAEYLGLALGDEVTTILSHMGGLGVRPFTGSARDAVATADLPQRGRDLGVDNVLTGHFLEIGDRLTVALEVIDVESGRLVWRDSFDAPASSMMATQVQLALRLRDGLAPVLGASAIGAVAEPKNEEAYAIYLASTVRATDLEPNREAIGMLERAIALDASYPPTWQALSKRYYIEARYGSGDPALLARGAAAAERAVALDPDYVVPATGLVVAQVERGELASAHQRATDLVRRHPDSVEAQFALSYVYRFAGLLEESARHCEAGFLLDPRNSMSGLRSCAVVFLLRGDYARTLNYLHLDQGSAFEQALSLHMLVRRGQMAEAARVSARGIPQRGSWNLLAACAQRKPAPEIAAFAAALPPSEEPETDYFAAAHLAYCGQTDAALDRLTTAIRNNYCAYPAMDADPLLASIKGLPAFASVRSAGIECQRRFLTAVRAAGEVATVQGGR